MKPHYFLFGFAVLTSLSTPFPVHLQSSPSPPSPTFQSTCKAPPPPHFQVSLSRVTFTKVKSQGNLLTLWPLPRSHYRLDFIMFTLCIKNLCQHLNWKTNWKRKLHSHIQTLWYSIERSVKCIYSSYLLDIHLYLNHKINIKLYSKLNNKN